MELSTLIGEYINLETKKTDLEMKKNLLILELKNSEYSDKLNLLDISDRIKQTSDNISKVDSDYAKEVSDVKKQKLAEIKKQYVDEYNDLLLRRDELLNKSPSDIGIRISEVDNQIISINKDIAIVQSEIYLSSSRTINNRKKSIEKDIEESNELDPISIEDIYNSTNEIKDIVNESRNNSNKIIDIISKLDSKIDNINISSGEGSGIFNKAKKLTKKLAKGVLNIGKKVTENVSNASTKIKSVADKINPFNLVKKAKSNVSNKINSVKENIKNSVTEIKNKLTPNILMSKKEKLSKSIELLGGTEKALLDLRLGVSTANINIYRLMRGMGFLVSVAGKQDDTSFVSRMRNKYINDTFNPRDIDKGIKFYSKDLRKLGGSPSSITKPNSLSNFLSRIFDKIKGVFKIAGSAVMGILKLIPLGSIIGPLIAVAGGYFLIKKLANTELVKSINEKFKTFYEDHLKEPLNQLLSPITKLISDLWSTRIKPGLAKIFLGKDATPNDLDKVMYKIFDFFKTLPKVLFDFMKTSLLLRISDIVDKAVDSIYSTLQTNGAGAGLGVGAAIAAGFGAFRIGTKAITTGTRIGVAADLGKRLWNLLKPFGAEDPNITELKVNESDIKEAENKKPERKETDPGILEELKKMFLSLLPEWMKPKTQEELDEDALKALDDDSMGEVDKADLAQDAKNKRGSESVERGKKLYELYSNGPTVDWSVKDINAYYDYLVDKHTHSTFMGGDDNKEIIKYTRDRFDLLKAKKSKSDETGEFKSDDIDIEKLQSEFEVKEKEKKENEFKYKKTVVLETSIVELSEDLRSHLDEKPTGSGFTHNLKMKYWEHRLNNLRSKLRSNLDKYQEVTGENYPIDNSLLPTQTEEKIDKVEPYTDGKLKYYSKVNSNNPRSIDNVSIKSDSDNSEVILTPDTRSSSIEDAPSEVKLTLFMNNSTELSEGNREDLLDKYNSKVQSKESMKDEVLATKINNAVIESNKEASSKSDEDFKKVNDGIVASTLASTVAAESSAKTHDLVSKYIKFDDNGDPHYTSILNM